MKRVAVAEKVPHGPGAVVHGHKIKNGEAKFKVISVLATWPGYDEDKHCKGTYLKWSEKSTEIKTKAGIKTHKDHDIDLLTESEPGSEINDEDQSVLIETLQQIIDINDLKMSQVLSLFKGDEYVGDGTFYADSIETDDILPEKISIYVVNVQKKFRQAYVVGNLYKWDLANVRKKKESRNRKPKSKKEWKKVEQKRLKTAGKKYVSRANKYSEFKERPEKKMKLTECGCKNTQCKDLSEEELQAAFDNFYQIKDCRLQKMTILKNIDFFSKKRNYAKENDSETSTSRPKEATRKYSINGKLVCKKLFMNTFGVSSV